MSRLLLVAANEYLTEQIEGVAAASFPGLEVTRARDLPECRDRLTADDVTLLVLDKAVFAGDAPGFFYFLEWAGRARPELPVVVAGENGDCAAAVRRAFAMGIADYIPSPPAKLEVGEALARALRGCAGAAGAPRAELPQKWVRPALQQSFVYDLIFGNITNAKEIYDKSKLLGLARTPNAVMVVTIDHFYKLCANKSELWRHNLRRKVYHAVQAALEGTSEAMLAIAGVDSMAVILALSATERVQETCEAQKFTLLLAEKILATVEEKTRLTVSVGVGNSFNDARQLHLSYREVCGALGHRFFLGGNQVIHVNDVEPYSDHLLNIEVSHELIKAMKMGDVENCRKYVRQSIEQVFSDVHADPESLKIQAFSFLALLVNAVKEAGVDKKKLLAMEFELGMELKASEVALDLKNWMRRVTDRLAGLVTEHYDQGNLKAVRQAIRLIEEKYAEELSLEEISRSVYLSPNYFSGIFRKETGYTVSDFITKARIEAAKKLLENIENSISDVGLKVGYRDPRYFCRVFKAVVGVTPSKYKTK